ncbi:helix-turn-helix transcriptional regulator [Paenibacillus sp. IB182496]|uniref:Helix-turn-helix transcriptional regulator n=1 Tax=Paenibacillus sabuli TaxID=2772509 RepID=A0A927BWA5_9BACL|nr:AraC family transcriptional regulator [Paenibacillus sabuli]MBD2846679.1 helix-turn-helix transcriptional regulator [Paenibacillus sabuli]
MKEKQSNSTRGIVHADAGRDKFSLARFEPGPGLEPFVEHYWALGYDVPPDTPYTQTVLSYPNVHLAFEQDEHGRRGLVYGVPQRPFVRELRGAGHVLGVKFRAGGFYPFWRQDVARLTGATAPASVVFGTEAAAWADAVLDADGDAARAETAERLLGAKLPQRDSRAELAERIVQETMRDPHMLGVEQLSARYGLSIRQLQRLFRRTVGVTPKWVIKRFRLQEAALQLERGEAGHWAELALQLGYYDQAHFIKDFKSVLGVSPAAYRREAAAPPSPGNERS